jgi:hypothetical protein
MIIKILFTQYETHLYICEGIFNGAGCGKHLVWKKNNPPNYVG